jgi:ribosome biogenesis protein ENP2
LIYVPLEQEKIGTYFIPELGHAPKWCAFLENMTEELEESKSTNVYDDYKFLTTADLDKLNASHLIGTSTLKAYMHGYFIEVKSYQKLLSLADPFAFEKYRQEQIATRMSQQRQRIQVNKKVGLSDQVKVNQALMDELAHKKGKGAK